jgi:hypothetical protein
MIRAHVLNVSRSGALVHAASGMLIGSMIVLNSGPLSVAGQVAWVDGTRLGLAFHRNISESQLEHLLTGGSILPKQPHI